MRLRVLAEVSEGLALWVKRGGEVVARKGRVLGDEAVFGYGLWVDFLGGGARIIPPSSEGLICGGAREITARATVTEGGTKVLGWGLMAPLTEGW